MKCYQIFSAFFFGVDFGYLCNAVRKKQKNDAADITLKTNDNDN